MCLVGQGEGGTSHLLTEVSENDLMNRPQMEPVRKKLLESALMSCQQIAEQRPQDDSDTAVAQARAQQQLGELYGLLERNEEALAALEEARASWDTMAQIHPATPEYRHAWAVTMRNLGRGYWNLGRYEQAMTADKSAADALDALAEAHPNTPEYREDAAMARNELGQVWTELGRHEEALAAYQRAQDCLTGVRAARPERASAKGQWTLAVKLSASVCHDSTSLNQTDSE